MFEGHLSPRSLVGVWSHPREGTELVWLRRAQNRQDRKNNSSFRKVPSGAGRLQKLKITSSRQGG